MSSPKPFELVVCQANNVHPRMNNGSFVQLVDESVLLVYQRWYTRKIKDIAPTRIEGKISRDNGRSWSDAYIIKEESGARVGSPSVFRLRSGQILLTHDIGDERDHRIYTSHSTDEGKSWTPSVPMMEEPGYYVSNNDRIARINSGRLLIPIAWHGRTYDPHGVCSCWYSDDEGENWSKAESDIDLPERGAMEPAVVELMDGRILMVIRTRLGRLFQSFSDDQGVHWQEATPMDLVSTEAPAAIKRIPGRKDLLIVWNHNYEPGETHMGRRNPLTSAISGDEGKSWQYRRDIENSEDFDSSYPAVFFKDDEVLVVYYYRDRETGYCSLKIKALPIDWFYKA